MFNAIKPLIDNGLLNEEAQAQIEEAWNAKVEEVREQAETDLRSEFATRYEHDKAKIVETLDRMVTESLTSQVQEIADEKSAIANDRASAMVKMNETAAQFEKFLTHVLAKELKEFKEDRNANKAALAKLESFVAEGLKAELVEFNEDKQDLINTKVKLVSEANNKFNALKKDFITRSGDAISSAVNHTLKAEITQLKEDIADAQKNNFGRKLFEAFASEFSATHLNENAEMRSLKSQIEEMQKLLETSKANAESAQAIVESKNQEINAINESVVRNNKINELMAPLSKDKASLMMSLLEGVETSKLKSQYDKYLPAVMTGKDKVLTESTKSVTNVISEVTGDRQARAQESLLDDTVSNIYDIKRLAGL